MMPRFLPVQKCPSVKGSWLLKGQIGEAGGTEIPISVRDALGSRC